MTADEIKQQFFRRVGEWERERMAEQKLQPRLEWNGVKIEFGADGGLTVFVPPEKFDVITRAGRDSAQLSNDSNTGRLYTRIMIAPFFAQQTSAVPAYSQPTETTR